MDGVDLVSVVRGNVFAYDRNRDRETLVDDRTIWHTSGGTTEKLRDGGNRAERLDAGAKLGALRRSEIGFEPEVDSVYEHGAQNSSDLAHGVELCPQLVTL